MATSPQHVQMDMLDLLHRANGQNLVRDTRRRLGLTQPEFGRLLGLSATTIRSYEHGERNPSAVTVIDLIDAVPNCGLVFNQVAQLFGHAPMTSKNPAAYGSIHQFVMGVRVVAGRNRAEFGATLGVTPERIAAFEHRIKPDPAFLQQLAKRYLHPSYSYKDLVARFRSLRPKAGDIILRSKFQLLHDPSIEKYKRDDIRAEIISDNVDAAKKIAARLARRYRYPGARDVWTEALVKAVDRHNPAYGDFIPYLRAYIQGAVRREMSTSRLSGIGQMLGSCLSRVTSARETLTQKLKREPSIQDIAIYTQLPVAKVAQILQAYANSQPLSLEAQTHERIPRQYVPPPAEKSPLPRYLLKLIDQLSDQSRRIIRLSVIEGLELDQVAGILDVPPTETGALLQQATHELRELATSAQLKVNR